DKERDVDSLVNRSRQVSMTYFENSFVISFSSLLFNSPDPLRYYYKLEGADKNWILAGTDQAARYNHLDNGHYTFRVKSVNRDGLSAESETTLNIFIRPPFW